MKRTTEVGKIFHVAYFKVIDTLLFRIFLPFLNPWEIGVKRTAQSKNKWFGIKALLHPHPQWKSENNEFIVLYKHSI